jgi:peroxiredoxin
MQNKIKVLFTGLILLSSSISMVGQKAGAANNKFTITVHMEGFTAPLVFMNYGTFNTSKLDSAVVHNGDFVFTGSVAEPVQAMIFTKNYQLRFDLFIENTKITVKGNIDAQDKLVVTGSPVVMEFDALNRAVLDNRQAAYGIYQKLDSVRKLNDTVSVARFQAAFDKQYKNEQVIKTEFIRTHPKSYISSKELLLYINGANLEEGTKLYNALDEKIRNSIQGKEIADRIAILNSTMEGKPALGFTQTDIKGGSVSLADYKGKYVLIEFWASWCGPCRAESPNLLKNYLVFKNKGLNVLSISLDNNADYWKKAIEKDGMPWTQVSDLKGWNNEVAKLYGIRAIPANFLIGPDGKIIARDLRGEILHKKLSEVFGPVSE